MSHAITTGPRVYVACLAAYNAGHLHGAWIDLTDGVEYFDAACATILRTSPVPDAEELEVHDHEHIGADVGLGESRLIAAWFDDAGTVPDGHWQQTMAAFHGCLRDAIEAGPHSWQTQGVCGPFEYRHEAESESEDLAWDHIADSTPNFAEVSQMTYVSIEYKAAARDWFDLVSVCGLWYVVEST